MSPRSGKTTKQKLIDTATTLFLEKGVDRVGVREIAATAGINLSLMNYYFRSKEILFETIFEIQIKERAHLLRVILDSEQTLENKIREYVSTYVDILLDNPLLVSFVMSIVHRSPDKIAKMKVVENLYHTESFIEQLRKELEAGNIKPIDPEQLFLSMISLVLFPFAIQPLIQDRNRINNEQFRVMMHHRKEHIFQLLWSSIKA
ncbi:MAG: TetR/AcrR family transcriptional regulator [Tenuifilaceae bacterium]|nr:TetR/AcrR family transcriptional regulator [Tenuifilaceae bacterium]